MMAFWRSPLIVAGLLLIVLGLGNWHTGLRKGEEYGQRLRAAHAAAGEQQATEFTALDATTNSMLLQSLNRRRAPYVFVYGKLDFYEVVHSGGRLLVLLGMFLAAAGVVHRQRRPLAPPEELSAANRPG